MVVVSSLSRCLGETVVISRGLLVGGELVEGTERVQRDPACWYPPGDHCTRPRPAGTVTDLLVLHWTAGRPGSDGREVYRSMRARKSERRPGQPLDVAVQLVAGWDGAIWQLADLTTPCVHVGDRGVIVRSIGVECRWPGTRRQAKRLGVYAPGWPGGEEDARARGLEAPWATVRVGSQRVEVMLPSPELLAAVRWIGETVASLRGRHGIAVPRRVPADATRFSRPRQRSWAGGQEHAHVPSSTKIDAAGLLVAELAASGWARG